MLHTVKEKLTSTWLVVRESVSAFDKNNNLDTSAALAYYGFFAIIPLCLLIIFILSSYIMSSVAAVKLINSATQDLLPEFSKAIFKEISSLSSQKKLWGSVGLITLLWSITPLAGGLRCAFTKIFKVDGHSFVKGKIKDFFAVLILVILFTLLALSEIAFNVVLKQLKFLELIPFAIKILNIVLPFILLPLFLMVFYITFSPVKLRLIQLIAGAFTTALLWCAIMPIFSLFLKYNPNYGLAFGSLKAIFVLIIWVYYAVVILLFGAEVMAAIGRKDTLLLKDLFFQQGENKINPLLKKFIHTYQTGQIIFEEGDIGNDMFLLINGEVRIKKGNQILMTVHPGEYFGEMSMLLDSPRSATALVCIDNTQIITIDKTNFNLILKDYPHVAIALLKDLATKLKTADDMLEQVHLGIHHN